MTQPRPAHAFAADYDAIRDAVEETARGRWFLAEFARRNRHADTERVLDALRRIEQKMAADAQAEPVRHPDLADLAAIFGVANGASPVGLTGEAIAEIAREAAHAGDRMRDQLRAGREALAELVATGGYDRQSGTLDRAMEAIDREASAQIARGRKLEDLSHIVTLIRDRVRRLVGAPARIPLVAVESVPPAVPAPANEPGEPDILVMERPADLAPALAALDSAAPPPTPAPEPAMKPALEAPAEPETAFESGLPLASVGPGARLRLAVADEQQALWDIAADVAPPAEEEFDPGAPPRRLADLNRLSYEQRHALFAA